MAIDFAERSTDKLGLYKALRKNGEDAGRLSANENYADSGGTDPLGLIKFWRGPEAGQVWYINRLIIQIRDSGTLDAEKYGNGVLLPNGVKIRQEDADETLILDMMDGEAVQTNAGWGIWAFNNFFSSYGQGDEFLTVEWAFARFGVPIVLQGDKGHRIVAIFNDDLSGLNEHAFFAHGWIETKWSDGSDAPFSERT